MVERIHGGAPEVDETPIGFIPRPAALDAAGLSLSDARLKEALRSDAGEWLEALSDLDQFYAQFGPRLPQALSRRLAQARTGFGG
ncbi:MAG TPA: phosphoenolpyruvate carboxykinase domain-containing protein [Methylomirabilota bacterium]|nr:phosphoenolpyruvate carboxykinase domain-containing protein [Methylomirabilota bacterium]